MNIPDTDQMTDEFLTPGKVSGPNLVFTKEVFSLISFVNQKLLNWFPSVQKDGGISTRSSVCTYWNLLL